MRDILLPKEWYSINRFLKELNQSYSPVVSVYVPISEASNMINTLRETERLPEIEEIEAIIEKRLASKKIYNGSICIFGWNAKEDIVIKEFVVSKALPPVYIVGKKPYTEPLHDILEINYDVLLIVLDHKEAMIRHYKGKDILQHAKIKTYLKGKHSKGGWSQGRFERLRDLQIKHFFNKVKERLKNINLTQIELILLAGPGLAKKEFMQSYINKNVRKKTRIIDGIYFSTPDDNITTKVINALDHLRKQLELQQLQKVEARVKKGLAEKENSIIHTALRTGAVDTLLIASDYYAKTPEENSIIINMIELAEKTSVEVEFITNNEVLEKLHKHGSVVATLRYKL
ncbi:MAG: peptide chain release factor 1 [Nanoarchaeota archaeon]|nr:peptide chain release factor 1 [Nanoarchaeota archaeon]